MLDRWHPSDKNTFALPRCFCLPTIFLNIFLLAGKEVRELPPPSSPPSPKQMQYTEHNLYYPGPFSLIHHRQVDTNILNIDMAALGNAAPFATGDPTICSGCRACLSDVSILNPARTDNASDTTQTVATADAAGVIEDVYDWKCEYCGEVNRVELDDMEKPVKGQDSVEYVIEPAPLATTSAGGKGDHDGKV